MTITFWIFLFCLSSLLGIISAKFFAKKSNINIRQSSVEEEVEDILNNARAQRAIILSEAKKNAQEQQQLEIINLENERNILLSINEKLNEKLNEKQLEADNISKDLASKMLSIKEDEKHILAMTIKIKDLDNAKDNNLKACEQQIERKAMVHKEELGQQLQNDLINTEKLNLNKWLLKRAEKYKGKAQSCAQSALNSVYLRYQPKFIWPKSSFVVQIPNKNILNKYFQENCPIINSLTENTDSSISVLTLNENLPSMLKISGGAGIEKEIIRLTIEEIFAKESFQTEKIKNILERHRRQINAHVLCLGEEAVKILQLKNDIHPEILKLIGALNYRTSHRQNQYFHSIEVARLAGMLADEIGVDSTIAKRAGLLHDIGKVLDYKIEGSHAVISGDYAAKFGEDETVVDTILAHHDDKIVETPFAYILKATDAMSGARPGARIDMEDGYNRRIDGISEVVKSFANEGVLRSAIMHAGREIHIYVDHQKVKSLKIDELAQDIAKKLEDEVEYPGQIRVTVIRRTEITEVA